MLISHKIISYPFITIISFQIKNNQHIENYKILFSNEKTNRKQ